MRKGCWPDFAAIGLVAAVGDQIDAEFALGAFGGDIDAACGHFEAFGVEFEVMDQGFHRLLHFGAIGRCDLAVVAAYRTFGHLLQALLHDADRLAHFFDADHEPVVAIAACADGNVKFHPVINVIRLAFADIPRDARATDHRAGKAPFDRVFL